MDAKFVYTTLDGKQRLESILMFIRDDNPELKIKTWKKYLAEAKDREEAGFAVTIGDGRKKVPFSRFSNEEIRNLREYAIPTIEITLDEATELDEIVELFVDINQYGERVNRIDIIKAIKANDPLLESVYKLIAEKKPKQMDVFTKINRTMFRFVLRRLSVISRAGNKSASADRMWSKLMELVLFIRAGNVHSKGSATLKKFMDSEKETALTHAERKKLRRVFSFLSKAYRSGLEKTTLAAEYSHFYIMSTALLSEEFFPLNTDDAGRKELIRKLTAFGKLIDRGPALREDENMESYRALSSRQTTDAAKRTERERLFKLLVNEQ